MFFGELSPALPSHIVVFFGQNAKALEAAEISTESRTNDD